VQFERFKFDTVNDAYACPQETEWHQVRQVFALLTKNNTEMYETRDITEKVALGKGSNAADM